MAIRNDLKMQKGKVAAQCGHASVAAYRKTLECDPTLLKKWYQFGKEIIHLLLYTKMWTLPDKNLIQSNK